MNRKLIVGVITAVVVVASVVIVNGCRKEKGNSVNNNEAALFASSTVACSFSGIDFSKIRYNAAEAVLEFESFGDYTHTIDALLEICNQYSEHYRVELEDKLGTSIEEADEETVSEYIKEDNFFPFNPLMKFIQQIGFTNSHYPVLRAKEIEWLASPARFETEANPFDVVGAGYVQSALHNTLGQVKIKVENDEFEVEFAGEGGGDDSPVFTSTSGNDGNSFWAFFFYSYHIKTNPDKICGKKDKDKDQKVQFYIPTKIAQRELRGRLVTTGSHVYGKTTNYYKSGKNWLLWTNRVSLNYGGEKWNYCDYESPISFTNINNTSWTGLTEKYFWFSKRPAYLIPDEFVHISGVHWTPNYPGNHVVTELKHH